MNTWPEYGDICSQILTQADFQNQSSKLQTMLKSEKRDPKPSKIQTTRTTLLNWNTLIIWNQPNPRAFRKINSSWKYMRLKTVNQGTDILCRYAPRNFSRSRSGSTKTTVLRGRPQTNDNQGRKPEKFLPKISTETSTTYLRNKRRCQRLSEIPLLQCVRSGRGKWKPLLR